ncbi:sensor domain-containing diguanylate cyclase [Marinomonas pollencensis]|uniref:diguanylate cyclase n=1 Tax=Marinomonas pollencensis TaxID=491954 RepID=A0A3E0DT42_9GAMM|nr:diguanylate cyclase [Marinomonas pollencensis]REG86727.1 diguanylate cyclase (GGDEF)-like protein [Marinomonas pollencensis]
MKTVPLRWLIVIPFVVLAVVLGAAMYLLSSVTIADIADKIGKQYIKEVEGRIYDRVQDFVTPFISIAEVNLAAFTHRPELLNDLPAVAGRFYEQALPYSQMTFISVATADGRYVNSTQSPMKSGQHNIAANFVYEPFVMAGFEYDPKTFIGPKIEADPTFLYDPRERPFYRRAVNNKQITWGNIEPYYGFPTLGIDLSAPIYDENGTLLGVTATSIALVELDKYLASLELVEGAYLFLAENNGDLIATSGQGALYQTENGVITRSNLNDHSNKAFQLASQSAKEGMQEIAVEGENYLYYQRSIDLKYGKQWQIGILIPRSYQQGFLDSYTQSVIVITLLLFICIAGVGSLVAWYIGKPIHRLSQAAKGNNLKSIQQLPTAMSGVREINALSQGLSSMADNLSDIMQNLEDKVAERTSYLQGENEHLLESALTDELTGLYNRRGFNQAIEEALVYSQEKGQQLTFVLCDIDHFKRVNDEFGHSVGDLALVSVAMNLKHHVRFASDIVARYGGEEFALVFLNADIEQVLLRLNRIRRGFAQNPVVKGEHITMSFGVVHVCEGEVISMEALIEQADKKLYQAKNTGRDQIIL